MCGAYGKIQSHATPWQNAGSKCGAQETGNNSGAQSLKLSSITTSDAFTDNVHRCHLQVAIWKAALLESPPEMELTKYGWELDHRGILVPRAVPSAPPDILLLIHCSCSEIGCTIFCLFEGLEAYKQILWHEASGRWVRKKLLSIQMIMVICDETITKLINYN